MTQPITRWKAGEEMRKRNHVIPVRLNAKELRFLEEQVEKSGLSREEYIRSIVMGGEVRARPQCGQLKPRTLIFQYFWAYILHFFTKIS